MALQTVVLIPLNHRERLLLKQVLQQVRSERTPVSQVLQLSGEDEMLPWDPTDQNQFFLGIQQGSHQGRRLGTFWGIRYPHRGSARLYDFQIVNQQAAGEYGMEALTALEGWLASQGCFELALEIHYQDPLTQALLERSGYKVARVHMRKMLRNRLPPM